VQKIYSPTLIQPQTPTDQTREAFDTAAPVYDQEYENLRGIIRLREITARVFLTYFSPGSSLLELNCGTGTDALTLARHGMKVLATDLSPEMIRVTQRKIAAAELDDRVTTMVLSFRELHDLRGRSFDGAYSNLGGLNCTNDLSTVAASLAPLIRPRGYFIAAVMPTLCLWETCTSLARLDWKKAMRRRNRLGTIANVHGGKVHTFYHSPKTFAEAFAEHFRTVRLLGLNIFTPPPNSAGAYRSLGRVTMLLEKLDDMVAELPFIPSISDHYIIVLQRKAE
jgi:ubiquinone/menaquinone biosynthesis C-methylase UbiE